MTQKIPASHAIEDLTLLLAYLTRFSENKPFETARSYRSWKGYDFDVLNSLDELGWIDQGSFRSKSLYLTDEGLQKAQDLLEKYGIEDWKKE